MNTQLISVQELFYNRIFRIPDYQNLLHLQNSQKHHTGVITVKRSNKEDVSKWEKESPVFAKDNWQSQKTELRINENDTIDPFYIVDGHSLGYEVDLPSYYCLIDSIDTTPSGNG